MEASNDQLKKNNTNFGTEFIKSMDEGYGLVGCDDYKILNDSRRMRSYFTESMYGYHLGLIHY